VKISDRNANRGYSWNESWCLLIRDCAYTVIINFKKPISMQPSSKTPSPWNLKTLSGPSPCKVQTPDIGQFNILKENGSKDYKTLKVMETWTIQAKHTFAEKHSHYEVNPKTLWAQQD
jgi:hypothetical protein